ncbi:MAG: hypothetical protein OEY14_15620, partial [Myxococcales bacterium]|nr:hypothetical protein [Myxococcales bacterium]
MSRALAWVPALLLLGSLQARAQPSPDPADAAQPAAPPPAETTPAAEPGPEPGPDPSPDPSPEPGAEPGAEPGPEPSAEPWPDRFQPLELGDEEARLRLSFIAQLQLSIENREAGDGQRQTDSSARIRRIRTLLRGAFLDGRVQSTLHLEVAPGAAELIDLFVDVALTRGLRLRVGQFKIPLTQYWQQSLTQLGTLDWSITSRTFGGERQLGLMAHDGAGGGEGLRYALGLFAGENRRGALARELPRIYGESHGNASSLLAPRPAGALHAELVGRVGHFAAELHPETLFDAQGGGLRHGLSF